MVPNQGGQPSHDGLQVYKVLEPADSTTGSPEPPVPHMDHFASKTED